MANIKKGFNFRNGVQVDDDNLKVSPTGLVGIGTTVPTEALDVRGNLVVTGVSSAITAQAGVMTVTTLNPSEIIGAGVSIVSGIVTASSGIITFYGDARFLQGMPTSQWEDVNTGLGVSSIYNTGGNVGIATSNPQFTLQIGANVNSFKDGVGISSFGNIKASGIITATDFNGNISGTGATFTSIAGNVTGNVTGLVNSSGISTFGGINATGRIVGSATSNVIPFLYSNLSDLPSASTYHGAFAHVHSQGKGYFAHAGNWWELVNKQQDGTVGTGVENYVIDRLVSTSTTATSLNVAGVSTFTGDATFNGNVVTGVGATVGIGSTVFFGNGVQARFGGSPSSPGLRIYNENNGTLIVSSNTAAISSGMGLQIYGLVYNHIRGDNTQILTSTGTQLLSTNSEEVILKHSGTEKLKTTDSGVLVSGIITATTELNSPLIGVGTDTPATDVQIQIRKESGDAGIQVTSDTGIAGLTVGRESNTSNTNNAEFRYGGGSGAPYSSAQSLDIINYGTGNFNYHISANNPGAAVGDYHWHKGINSGKLMTLTNTGRLGIGETQPNETLTVSGVCTISSNSFVGGNFFVAGNTTIGGDVSIDGNLIIPSINTNITGNLTGSVFGNVNIFSGISTFKKVGVNTTICFDSLDFDGINAIGAFKRLGIGQTQPDGILDVSGEDSNPVKKFILLPQVSAGSTSVIQSESAEGGGLIYNTTLRKLQFHNGTNWETVTSVEVTG